LTLAPLSLEKYLASDSESDHGRTVSDAPVAQGAAFPVISSVPIPGLVQSVLQTASKYFGPKRTSSILQYEAICFCFKLFGAILAPDLN
jgi:hypothetical protein